MASPNLKLAESLKVLKKIQKRYGSIIRTEELSDTHRVRLVKSGFIQEIIRGWYIITQPDETMGDSTVWYPSFWLFCSRFLENKYKSKWCISPEQSLLLQVEKFSIPKQLIIRSPNANNTITKLPNNTTIVNSKLLLNNKNEIEVKDGLRMLSLPSALVNCNERFIKQNAMNVRIALSLINNSSEILELLIPEGRSVVAGRLAGAFRNIGRDRIANEIVNTMKALSFNIREVDPFVDKTSYSITSKEKSPCVMRIHQMWKEMREDVLKYFPKYKSLPKNKTGYLKDVEEVFLIDAYNSLSIEGYQVTAELIERVANGTWDPDKNEKDKEYKNAMAAKGYWQAFQKVKLSTEKILNGGNAGNIVDEDHSEWYRELFAPSVTSGFIKSSDIAGYRNAPVYIRNSFYVPMNYHAVRDVMPAFFELLRNENEPAVRVVLGHFMFVYIHPYMDGNGRIGRFVMNTMLASGGYPWTVIPVEERKIYMDTLENASVDNNIVPFTKYIARLVNATISGNPIAKKVK